MGGATTARSAAAAASASVSSSVAKALHLSAQGVYLMPARHDQEGAPKAGSNDWIPGARPGCMPFALLGEQAEVPVALISWFHDARQRPASAKQGQAVRRLTLSTMPACSHANPLGPPAPLPSTPAHRQSSSGPARAPGPKGGRQVGLDIQVQLLESIHSQSTPDTRAAQEQR